MATQMTFVLGPDDLDDAARRVARRWGWYLVGGLALVVIGVLLLADIFTAARTLALLVALAIAMQGIDEIVNASRYRPKWPAYLIGTLLLVTAVIAAVWPDITLWALAVVTGIGFILSGVTELVMVLRYHHDLPYRWLFIVLGAATVIIGVFAVAWPDATILVLAILLGLRVLISGCALIAFSFGLRALNRELAA